MRKAFLLLCLLLPLTVNAQQLSVDAMIDRDMASMLSTYKMLHAAPELSHREEKTASFFAGELRKLGYTVTERVGKFDNADWTGYGVVAVMANGTGRTVLVRTELDALTTKHKQLWKAELDAKQAYEVFLAGVTE